MEKKLICIVCPKGCEINIQYDEDKKVVTALSGNGCKRGEEYARSECISPVRTLTTTVRTAAGGLIPVRTSKPIPRGMMFECMRVIAGVQAPADAVIGDVIVSDILGTGADIIASGNA